MVTSKPSVTVRNERRTAGDSSLPLPDPISIPRSNMRMASVAGAQGLGANPAHGHVVTVDLIRSLLPVTNRNATNRNNGAGSRHYLLPPPSPG